jgi:hypothetical protein
MRIFCLIIFLAASGLFVGACTSRVFDENQKLFAPVMLEPQMKMFAACVEVFDPIQARQQISEARKNKKISFESKTSIEFQREPTQLQRYFLSMHDCNEYLIDLEYQGWKKH